MTTEVLQSSLFLRHGYKAALQAILVRELIGFLRLFVKTISRLDLSDVLVCTVLCPMRMLLEIRESWSSPTSTVICTTMQYRYLTLSSLRVDRSEFGITESLFVCFRYVRPLSTTTDACNCTSASSYQENTIKNQYDDKNKDNANISRICQIQKS